jgi:hypothetical protein
LLRGLHHLSGIFAVSAGLGRGKSFLVTILLAEKTLLEGMVMVSRLFFKRASLWMDAEIIRIISINLKNAQIVRNTITFEIPSIKNSADS